MFLGILVLVIALTISSVAIYYSVAGLVAIFAAASLPIIIMGTALEVGKLVTTVWLHRYWKEAKWWLKSYLSIAVIVLMFITSMGIFGFLSKAHIEQTAGAQESIAQVERLVKEIAAQEAVVLRADERIVQLESTGTGSDANVQSQIDKEQERIDSAYTRIQPSIDEQQRIIDSQAQLYKDELAKIDTALAQLQSYIDAGGKDNIAKAQAMVGTKADGAFGPATAAKFKEWQDLQQTKRNELLPQIQEASNNTQARAARDEIQRLRLTAETQISDSNKLIARLREQVGNTNKDEIDQQITDQRNRITEANNKIDTLTEEKYTLEAEYRKLEAEVGPVKYLAEFIYGETANQDLLESAVRWVIIIIIFVFDPLAVLLLIASQTTFEMRREAKKHTEQEYLRLRAAEGKNNDQLNGSDIIGDNWKEEIAREYTTGNTNSISEESTDINGEIENHDKQFRTVDNGGNNSTGIFEPEEEERRLELEEKENDTVYKNLKQNWKVKNPNQSAKFWKDQYIKGKVNKLPWDPNE